MPEFLSDPINLSVIGLVAVLIAGPSAWAFLKGKVSVFKPDPMRQIGVLKRMKKSVPDEVVPKIDDICRLIFEESLK